MIAAFSPELPSASRRSVSATKAENELKATVADADVEAAMAGTAGVVTEDAIVEQAEPASAVALEAPMAVEYLPDTQSAQRVAFGSGLNVPAGHDRQEEREGAATLSLYLRERELAGARITVICARARTWRPGTSRRWR